MINDADFKKFVVLFGIAAAAAIPRITALFSAATA